jgi:hypothetical protein
MQDKHSKIKHLMSIIHADTSEWEEDGSDVSSNL